MAINGESVIAVIPCRAGSVRCPGKNWKEFRGKPLFLWSVEAAKDSKYIDKFLVSTDSNEVKEICKAYDIQCLARPPEFATSEALNEDVLRSVLRFYDRFTWVVLLQPTSPLRTGQDIDNCLNIAQGADGCTSRRMDHTKNGAVYVAKVSWIQDNNFDQSLPTYHMADDRSLDIDYPEQFE